MKKHLKAKSSPGEAMKKNPEPCFARNLTGSKENCPSGYRCRTRHPKGAGCSFLAGLSKERGRIYPCHQDQGRNEKRAQLIPRNKGSGVTRETGMMR